MKYVYLALNWIFGTLFLLIGIYAFFESPQAGLCLVISAVLLLPPARNFAYKKTNKTFPAKARAITILSLIVAFGIFIGQAHDKREHELAMQQAKERAEKAAQLKQKTIDEFISNRDQIIASLKQAMSEKDYQSVITQSNKYLVSGDKELKSIHTQAKTEELLIKLKDIPTKEYEKNRNLYGQLLKMHPDNEVYINKVTFYSDKIKQEIQKRVAAENRKKNIESQFSSWDGSHRNLEHFIKDSMNDPVSYDHDKTVYWDIGNHLVVRTTFRGKNAFGGVVKNTVKAKVSLDGQILQILEQY